MNSNPSAGKSRTTEQKPQFAVHCRLVSIRTPDRQKDGFDNFAVRRKLNAGVIDGGPAGARRAAPSNPSAGIIFKKMFECNLASNGRLVRTPDIRKVGFDNLGAAQVERRRAKPGGGPEGARPKAE